MFSAEAAGGKRNKIGSSKFYNVVVCGRDKRPTQCELNPVLSSFIHVATKLLLRVYFFLSTFFHKWGVCSISRFVISTFRPFFFFSLLGLLSYSGQRLFKRRSV